MLHQFLRLN